MQGEACSRAIWRWGVSAIHTTPRMQPAIPSEFTVLSACGLSETQSSDPLPWNHDAQRLVAAASSTGRLRCAVAPAASRLVSHAGLHFRRATDFPSLQCFNLTESRKTGCHASPSSQAGGQSGMCCKSGRGNSRNFRIHPKSAIGHVVGSDVVCKSPCVQVLHVTLGVMLGRAATMQPNSWL